MKIPTINQSNELKTLLVQNDFNKGESYLKPKYMNT